MKKKILIVMGGLAIGGVETYVLRLARELSNLDYCIDIFILSKKADEKLLSDISKTATVYPIENVKFLSASSWINALLPIQKNLRGKEYDIVHVVDLLTLGFIFLNKEHIKFKALSIGIYHALELSWWRDKNVYFRKKLLALYDRNITLTLFPNENTAAIAGRLAHVNFEKLQILPLGIDLSKYSESKPKKSSRKIISVGRLVDFKVYNKHMISQLNEIRELGDFHYYIYGEGTEKESLKRNAADLGVADYVHFMGEVQYSDFPQILNDCFCFIGSGTAIIEASAAGIPSIVGIESIKKPYTCGFFSDIKGYSYNEESATTNRITFFEAVKWLNGLSEKDFIETSKNHRLKASEFDLKFTAKEFIEKSCAKPDFKFSFNRWIALISFFSSIIRMGPRALKTRFDTIN